MEFGLQANADNLSFHYNFQKASFVLVSPNVFILVPLAFIKIRTEHMNLFH